jgi:hypothetical protein
MQLCKTPSEQNTDILFERSTYALHSLERQRLFESSEGLKPPDADNTHRAQLPGREFRRRNVGI